MKTRFLAGTLIGFPPRTGKRDPVRMAPNSRWRNRPERRFRLGRVVAKALILTWICSVGCESLYQAGVPGMERFVDFESRDREEEQYRRLYQEKKEPDALQWLLINRIQSGLSLEEINELLGNEGVRVVDDMRFKTKGGHYRRDDQIYKWGPTNDGKSLYLGFREGMLVNFDPGEYIDGLP